MYKLSENYETDDFFDFFYVIGKFYLADAGYLTMLGFILFPLRIGYAHLKNHIHVNRP